MKTIYEIKYILFGRLLCLILKIKKYYFNIFLIKRYFYKILHYQTGVKSHDFIGPQAKE